MTTQNEDDDDVQYTQYCLQNARASKADVERYGVDRTIAAAQLGVLAQERLLASGSLSPAALQAQLALNAKGLADKLAIKVSKELDKDGAITTELVRGALAVSELSKAASICFANYAYTQEKQVGAATKPSYVANGFMPKSLKKRMKSQ